MKTFLSILTTVGVVLALSACGQNKDKNGQTVAVTPPTSQCLMTPTAAGCTPNAYSTMPGFYPYPIVGGGYTGYEVNFQNGFCGCNSGYNPVYNNTWGLGCVQSNYVAGFTAYAFGWAAPNSQFLNIQQRSFQPNIVRGSSCYMDVQRACDSTIPQSCGNNGYCQSINGGSRAGVCVYSANYSPIMGVFQ